jgi:hypothetical protein
MNTVHVSIWCILVRILSNIIVYVVGGLPITVAARSKAIILRLFNDSFSTTEVI